MSSALLLFPIHLFKEHDLVRSYNHIYLIEEPRYFTDYAFHKLKLAYHRASMKYYHDYIKKSVRGKTKITYVEFHKVNHTFYQNLAKKHDRIDAYDPNDHSLELLLTSYGVQLLASQNFAITRDEAYENLSIYYVNGKRFNFMNFYKYMRRKLDILITKSGDPVGGKWSFDAENRKPYGTNAPAIPPLPSKSGLGSKSKYMNEACAYVRKHFPKNEGILDEEVAALYPITHEDAAAWCVDFCKKRFAHFGLYEDAIISQDAKIAHSEFLFHSVLSPMMNIGLITDREVLAIVAKWKDRVPLPAYEGFIRQVIGWRNYVYAIYATKYGNPNMSILDYYKMIAAMNAMKHTRPLPYAHFWRGSTKIPPVDDAIQTIRKYGYVHHIQRLMVLGNVLFLLKTNPHDVFKIFMEWTIDAYEWVMTPNVYGMSQYADGGKMMTRPYFSSSNYIRNMSDYTCSHSHSNNKWCEIWDALYGEFIAKHVAKLKRIYATARMVVFYQRKSAKEKKDYKKIAKSYISYLDQ